MENNNKVKELWYMPAIKMFANVSGWIAGPIIIALFVGKYLDKKYNSDPWFFIGLTGIAFIISIFGIIKILMKYLKEIEREAEEKKSLHQRPAEEAGKINSVSENENQNLNK